MKTVSKATMKKVVKMGVGLVALTVSASATADTTVTYSGYECLFAGSNGNQGGFIEGARIESDYTMCPIDRPNSGDTSDITGIHIRVNDTSSSENVDCFAVACDGLGDSCTQTAWHDSSGTGVQSIYIGSITPYTNGYAYIFCEMPNTTSVIYSYRATD